LCYNKNIFYKRMTLFGGIKIIVKKVKKENYFSEKDVLNLVKL
jgi:hypothetical protein